MTYDFSTPYPNHQPFCTPEPPYHRREPKYELTDVDCTVEEFLVKFPEFEALLKDASLASDFIQSELDATTTEILIGEWPTAVVKPSIYLLLAHYCQLRFMQLADNAVRGVNAAKGTPISSSLDTHDLSISVYGQRLLNLRSIAQEGGITL